MSSVDQGSSLKTRIQIPCVSSALVIVANSPGVWERAYFSESVMLEESEHWFTTSWALLGWEGDANLSSRAGKEP